MHPYIVSKFLLMEKEIEIRGEKDRLKLLDDLPPCSPPVRRSGIDLKNVVSWLVDLLQRRSNCEPC